MTQDSEIRRRSMSEYTQLFRTSLLLYPRVLSKSTIDSSLANLFMERSYAEKVALAGRSPYTFVGCSQQSPLRLCSACLLWRASLPTSLGPTRWKALRKIPSGSTRRTKHCPLCVTRTLLSTTTQGDLQRRRGFVAS